MLPILPQELSNNDNERITNMRNISKSYYFRNSTKTGGILAGIRARFNRAFFERIVSILPAAILACFISGCDDKKPEIPSSNIRASELQGVKVSFSDQNNQILSVPDFVGKVLIIIFSTTWCPNCPDTIRSLEKLNAALSTEGIKNVKIIIVNLEDRELTEIVDHYRNIAATIEAYSIKNAQIDCIKGVPACIVFDKSGKAVFGHLGANDFSSDKFKNYIKYLSENGNL